MVNEDDFLDNFISDKKTPKPTFKDKILFFLIGLALYIPLVIIALSGVFVLIFLFL